MPLKIMNKGKVSEIWITGEIGESWFGDSISAKMFIDEYKKIPKDADILLHVNSPGGDVFDGLTIYNLLLKHRGAVTVEIESIAASIASVIAMAGNTISMAENATLMIHDPWAVSIGSATDMRDMAERLDMVKDQLIMAYARKTKDKTDIEEIAALMESETWMTASEAMDKGFVTEISEAYDMAASANFDLTKFRYRNIPRKNTASTVSSVKSAPVEDKVARMRLAHMQMTDMKLKKLLQPPRLEARRLV